MTSSEVGTGAPNKSFPVIGAAKLAWDDQNLYVAFVVTDPDLVGGFKDDKNPTDYTVTGQPKPWTKETVEMMTDPGPAGDNKTYYELQVNPQNKVFYSQFDDYNLPKTEPNGPYGHEDWDPKLKSAVVVQGTLDTPGDKDTGYTVEASIPWTAFSKAASSTVTPAAQAGRHLAHQLLRHEGQRRRLLVADPRRGQLPPRVPLRQGRLVGAGHGDAGDGDGGRGRRRGRGPDGDRRQRRGADAGDGQGRRGQGAPRAGPRSRRRRSGSALIVLTAPADGGDAGNSAGRGAAG